MNSVWPSIYKRTKTILVGGFARVISSFTNLIISIIVIRIQSPELWGEIVPLILFIDFGFSFVNWGSSPYLIRAFSANPAGMKEEFSESISSRFPLLFVFILILFLSPFSFDVKILLVIWSFFRYIYQSFDSLLQFQRNFLFTVAIECVSIAIVVMPVIFFPNNVHLFGLVTGFTLAIAFKAIATSVLFHSYLRIQFAVSKKFFARASPFLLLTFSAMLQQRADLYCVAFFLNTVSTARYQVFINLLIFFQFLASLLLNPFAKNIFRLSKKSLRKLEINFALIGIPLSLLSITGVYIIIRFFYQFDFSGNMFLMGAVYIFLFYAYLIQNYLLGKENKQILVSVYSLIASLTNVLLCYLLTPRFGIEGALGASLIAQITLVVLYHRKKLYA
jgi:O-antigen/teichoic acid export membrane protein